MFVVLKPIAPGGGFFAGIKLKKEISRRDIKSFRTEQGLPFMVLEAFSGKRGLDWEEICDKCGRYAARMIMPEGIAIPGGCPAERFVPSLMPALLNFNTAAELLGTAALPPDSFSLTLADREGRLSSALPRLLPLSSKIRVITERPEKFTAVCAEIYESCGASVMLRPIYEKASGREAVICCDGCAPGELSGSLVFTFSPAVRGAVSVFGRDILLSDEHAAVIGDSIDPVTFSGALTELCGCREYRNSPFYDIRIFKGAGASEFEDFLSAVNNIINS